MTRLPFTLLLPASPQRGRRSVGVVASVIGHTLALLMLGVVRLPSRPAPAPAPAPVAAAEPTPIVWVAPVPPPAPPPERPVPPVRSKPVTYAAAPPGTQPGRDWRELLPRALALQTEGLNAPSFVIENLDVALVGTLATRGLAVTVAGRPPFVDARQVRWTATGAADAGVLPSAWTQRVARRAIILPRDWVRALSLAPGEQVYLLISTDLDAAILAAQLAAAEQRGVALGALLRTRGRILPTADGILGFHIDAVDFQS